MQSYHPETQQEYHRVTTKMFKNSLVNIPLFAVPAFLALFLGQKLDAKFETGNLFLIIFLFSAFFFSWFVILQRNAKLTKEYKAVREKMKQEQVTK